MIKKEDMFVDSLKVYIVEDVIIKWLLFKYEEELFVKKIKFENNLIFVL